MHLRSLLGLVCFAVILLPVATAQDTASEKQAQPASPDRGEVLSAASAQISKAVDAYVAAFNAADVEKLAPMWTPDAVYSNQSSGERVMGRKAIVAQFKEVLADRESAPKLAVQTRSVEFVSPSVALERGTAVVTRGEDDVTESDYTAVYVNRGDAWLIDRISEEEITPLPSQYEKLKDLQWLIGDWVDAGDGFEIETNCKWTENQNYISRTYSVATPGGFASSGLQIIGWDAAAGTIRSWLFDSNGVFVSGTWAQRDGKWKVQSVATLPDGRRGSFTSIFTPTEDGNYAWQKVNRVLDGKLLPNIDEVVIQRR